MLPYKTIYNQAIDLFDDPIYSKAYKEDTVRWEKMMYPHLINGLADFTNPTKIRYELINRTEPTGKIEIFDGDGSATYTLSTTPAEGSDFSYMINGLYDYQATYDADTNSVTFSKIVPVNSKCSVEWYQPGCFTSDFSSAAAPTVDSAIIQQKVTEILARALVYEWASKEQNFLLDIKNLLTDTDFKIYSPANSIKAKVQWANSLKYNLDTLTNNLAWELNSRKYHGGNYYV